MSVSLEAQYIAIGDYSSEYGTVSKVLSKDNTIHIEFVNGKSLILGPEDEMEIDQGGRFDHYRDRVSADD